MNKTAVVYKSKYGSTKRYADWIADELKADIFEASKITAEGLRDYGTVVFGGGLYGGGVSGIGMIVKDFEKLKDKHIIVFTCGLADTGEEANIKGILAGIDRAVPREIKEKLVFFHLRGGIDYQRLGLVHRAMMAMMKKMLSSKNPADLRAEDRQMLDTYGKKVDFTDRKAIIPIVEYCRGLRSERT